MQTRLKYFLYIRKSTDDNTHQVLSLPAQRSEFEIFLRRERLEVVESIEESRTAKAPGRPLFNEMLDRIEQGEANGILCWDIDRLYRNPVDDGRVRWMLQRGVIASIRTPGREYLPRDAGMLMAVEGGRAVEHNLSFTKGLARTRDEKLRRGQWPGALAPLGYVFDHLTKNIAPHTGEAEIVRTIYSEVATGRIGLHAAGQRLSELGVKSRGGIPYSKSVTRKILTNRLYVGIMVWKGQAYEGKHKPLIPLELFEAVQKAIKVRSKPRKVRKGHQFPFCGVFRCSCGSMMTAQWAKGHGGLYRYYRCTRKGLAPCNEPYLREEGVVSQTLAKLGSGLSQTEAAEVNAIIDEAAKTELGAAAAAVQTTAKALEETEEKLRKLTHCLLNGIVDEDSYRLSKDDLIVEKTRLKQEKQRLQRRHENSWIEPTRRVINTLETLGKNDSSLNLPEIAELVQEIGTNPRISRKTVSFSISEPYDFTLSLLAEMRIALSATPSLHSDKNWWSTKWCAREDLNLHPLRDQILSLACLPFHHSRKRPGWQLICSSEVNATIAPAPVSLYEMA